MASNAYFGIYGGSYVPEMLQPTLRKLAKSYDKLKADPEFQRELHDLQTQYNSRPTPLI